MTGRRRRTENEHTAGATEKDGRAGNTADPQDTESRREKLGRALYLGILCCFDQGFSMIRAASETYGWQIVPEEVSRIWRAGCILRSDLVKRLPELFGKDPGSLLGALPEDEMKDRYAALKEQLQAFLKTDTLCAAWLSVYSYIRYEKTDRMPVQLLQGLRDYFGSHTYERFDQEGSFHTVWK